VYSCSGCSSAAQMANHLAVRLDRSGVAEMSCIAGVGGDVPSLVRVARSGRPLVAIDGCALRCVVAILRRHGLQPAYGVNLATWGVRKRLHEEFDAGAADLAFERMRAAVVALAAGSGLGREQDFPDAVGPLAGVMTEAPVAQHGVQGGRFQGSDELQGLSGLEAVHRSHDGREGWPAGGEERPDVEHERFRVGHGPRVAVPVHTVLDAGQTPGKEPQ
jgi:uncharacterized metal-binding protein